MKNRKDFRQIRIKIFLRTIAALVTAVSVIYITYSVLLRGRFADGMVALFQTALGIKYDAALQLYERIFRSHMDAMILFSILLIFAVLFYFYLRWLTRYFETVSEGMDLLLADAPGEISLPRSCSPLREK